MLILVILFDFTNLKLLYFVFFAGIAVLVAAGFFGYMLALLQRRVGLIVSTENVRSHHPHSALRFTSEKIASSVS